MMRLRAAEVNEGKIRLTVVCSCCSSNLEFENLQLSYGQSVKLRQRRNKR